VPSHKNRDFRCAEFCRRNLLKKEDGGQGWIRTSVGVSQQIYSLPPLATRAPTHCALRGAGCMREDPEGCKGNLRSFPSSAAGKEGRFFSGNAQV
jgi:hypothetical protein